MKHIPAPLSGVGLPAVHARTLEALNQGLESFLSNGVFIGRPWYMNDDLPLIGANHILRRHFRLIAKEYGRPYVTAEGGQKYMLNPAYVPRNGQKKWIAHTDPEMYHMYVTIPRRKYMEPLMPPLYLQNGDNYQSPVYISNLHATRLRWNGKTKVQEPYTPKIWTVHFEGKKGRQAFEGWLNYIRTQPECRKALKLDT